MSDTFTTSSTGVSPAFSVSAEDLLLNYFTTVTPVNIDGVKPPDLGEQSGFSNAMTFMNMWFPWIDEKIVEPKWDGVCAFLGTMSNRPTYIKDYHMISMMRATDYIMQPQYIGLIQASSQPVTPIPPPTTQPN